MNCTIIKETIRIDEYLAHKGLQPSKVTANGIWYNSPITGETHPSFQVSPNGRFFHDWSSGAKGTIIDLSLSLYPGSLIHDAIIDITSNSNINISQSLNSIRYIEYESSGLRIIRVNREICRKLQGYAYGRGISREILSQYCVEIEYENAGKIWHSLGFPNNKGGYEIRSHGFKGAAAPKGITILGTNHDCPYLIFEGFFDFLSAVQLGWFRAAYHNAIVMNSTAMVSDCVPALHDASRVICMIDNDEAGKSAFRELKEAYPTAEDYSFSFLPAKDLNEYVTSLMKKSKIRPRKYTAD